MNTTQESVQEYYGRVLETKDDLQTSACCAADSVSQHLRELMSNIHPEVMQKFYGCGAPVPPQIEGTTIIDLGSGSGRDAYLLSQLVGPQGRVIGVDMTEEQLSVANAHIGWHMDKFGFDTPNVEFRHGYIEDLKAANIEDNCADAIISNCVINLSPNKRAVFSETFRVLKPGGELYFSDVFANIEISEELQKDPVLYGECLSGAMTEDSFAALLREFGCESYEIISDAPIDITNPEIAEKLDEIEFTSLTIRAFKTGEPSRKHIPLEPAVEKKGCC